MPNNKKVVIIEDEADLSLLLKDYFSRRNYDVQVANTLSMGKIILSEQNADIVFLDNNLPDGYGWAYAPIIASDMPGAYIVLISAFHPPVPDMPLGSNYWVVEKPLSFSELDKKFSHDTGIIETA